MATGGGANLALSGDPRSSPFTDEKTAGLSGGESSPMTRPQMRAMRDPNVSFSEYQHYAALARADEEASRVNEPSVGLLGIIFPSKKTQNVEPVSHRRESKVYYKGTKDEGSPDSRGFNTEVTDEEWMNAQRAVRQMTGAAVFYLITTDILGPFAMAYSFASVGWAPGVVLFTIFAVLAGYSGWLLNVMFCGLDSYEHPNRSYGDMAYRLAGNWARYPVNILQSIQLLLTVAIITLGNGLALSIVARFNICYVVCIVILLVVGMVMGQVRTLQKFGWLANASVFMTVFTIILTMAVAATSGPNYQASALSAGFGIDNSTVLALPDGSFPPVQHYTNLPPSGSFIGAVNGIMNTVYAYGGANIFNEIMSEMRRPRDFLKAMWSAQFFIWACYMFYGLFMYYYQGQYSINPSPQTVSPYWAIVVANIFYIISALIAAVLYGNIGLKVIYNNLFVEIFRAPALTERRGKILWVFFIIIYWAISFVIGASIPAFGALVGFVGALCITQFTYTLPPFFYMIYQGKRNALQTGEGYDPATGRSTHHDSGFKRFRRGITGGTLLDKVMMGWNLIFTLGALALAGLGIYAAVELMIEAFADGANAFSCKSPLEGAGYA